MKSLRKNTPESLSIQQWLMISAAFSVCLLIYRVITTTQHTHAYLIWNLFLAWIPFSISGWLEKNFRNIKSKPKLALLIFCWLLFIPNTFYIITDLFHLDNLTTHHQWFDLVMILSFAWNGILFGIISIRKMEAILTSVKGKLFSSVMIFVVMWLNGFGVYIGRYLRFNSWDVITDPFSLFGQIAQIVFDPIDHRWVWAMTICFSVFMLIIYYTIKKLSETFHNH